MYNSLTIFLKHHVYCILSFHKNQVIVANSVCYLSETKCVAVAGCYEQWTGESSWCTSDTSAGRWRFWRPGWDFHNTQRGKVAV